ncbi:hypothetical protein [Aureivirga sp. CE67]|uniref:hypothetical protein n=1 Tax=Aureivirga sp. CE67 TaxID=1788983 RepID=UPI0018CB1AFA|nr:hypothetical protein [Aureivirga sp. CE67]
MASTIISNSVFSRTQKGTGEFGRAKRKFNNTNVKNIGVSNPQGIIEWGEFMGIPYPKSGDYHNSHNRVNDWINISPAGTRIGNR